jgi:hypothetical protein
MSRPFCPIYGICLWKYCQIDVVLKEGLDEIEPKTSTFSTRFGIMKELRVFSPMWLQGKSLSSAPK